MSQPDYLFDYLFYPTLLDSFQYYLTSESDTAYQEILDRLNRKPFTSEAASKGTAFNDLVDKLIQTDVEITTDAVSFREFEFKTSILKQFTDRLQGATSQYRCEGVLRTNKGVVKLYGYVDEILCDTVIDIKTTASYTFPKFLNNLQHLVYPFCLKQEGINVDRFKYMITDFSNYYEEEYLFEVRRDVPRLIDITEQLIDFIELNSDRITDRKLFNYRQAA